MEVWYIASYRWSFGEPIERREFVRSTDKMLIDKQGNKHAKETQYDKAFLTWEDARDFLLEKAQERVDGAEKRLEQEHKKLAEVQSLAKPKEEG